LNIPSGISNPFQIVAGTSFSAALAVSTMGATPTVIAYTPTAITLPNIPPSLPQPSRASQYITIDGGGMSALTPFTGSMLAVGRGSLAAIDASGTLTVTTNANSLIGTMPADWNSNIYTVALGNYGVILRNNHTVGLWGSGNDLTNTIPTNFQTNIAEIAIRGTHVMLRTIDGRVWSNQLPLPLLSNVRHIAAGATFAVVSFTDGSVRVWATDNSEGVLSIPSNATNITEIAAGDYHVLALRANGQVVSWGATSHDNDQTTIPFAVSSGNVIAIAAGERQSMALLANGNAVAWGDYPANTLDHINAVSSTHHITGIATGDQQVAVLIDNSVPTVTVVPSATPIIVPTTTPRANHGEFVANQIAWYTMSDFAIPQSFAGLSESTTFQCPQPQSCPRLSAIINAPPADGRQFPSLIFSEGRGDELSASTNTTLNGVPFTVRASLKRTSLNRHDVMLSLGAPGVVRQYLTLGIDKENRPYCSFYADDLRSTSWYVDREWHAYACSYDPTSRIRTLWRDGQIIGQDIVRGAFTPPAAPLVIGRRYDSMAGVNGEIAEVDIVNRVLNQTELQPPNTVLDSAKITGLVINTLLQSVSPNGGVTVCQNRIDGTPGMCPFFDQEPTTAHDGAYIQFPGDQRLSITTSNTPNGFSIGAWVYQNQITPGNVIVSRSDRNNDGAGMYIHETTDTDGSDATTCSWVNTSGSSPVVVSVQPAFVAPTQEWHHYLCSYDHNLAKMAFYVDGVLIQQVSVTPQAIPGSVLIGYNNPSISFPASNFMGNVDDVMIYDGAVSGATVAEIVNSTNPSTPIPTPTPTNCPAIDDGTTQELDMTSYEAWQSSDYNAHDPQQAIDDYTPSYSFTEIEDQPWWEVDLGETYDISSVKLIDSTGLYARNTDLFLTTMDLDAETNIDYVKSQSVAWRYVKCDDTTGDCNPPAAVSHTVTFPSGSRARYIRIQHEDTGRVRLNEVRVTARNFVFECGSPPPPTATFTPTQTGTRTTTPRPSKTSLAATVTPTMPGITPYTVTKTATSTRTSTNTSTNTRTATVTVTPTLPSATPYRSPTRSAVNTRTPLFTTRTMLARRSPTFYAQTQTARAITSTPSKTATATPTAAYPLPATRTRTATAYPLPATRTATATRTP
jgi:hypothetical protein